MSDRQRRIKGVVDRIEGDMVVVLITDPQDPTSTREVFVPRSRFKQVDLQEGDQVTVVV